LKLLRFGREETRFMQSAGNHLGKGSSSFGSRGRIVKGGCGSAILEQHSFSVQYWQLWNTRSLNRRGTKRKK
jgi:hypothetical protein